MVVAGWLVLSCAPMATDRDSDSKSSYPPDFQLPTLDGGSLRLSDHLGARAILLDFWATFCEPCLRAMPHLSQLSETHRSRGLLVLGISIDSADSLPEVRAIVQRLRIPFPILLDYETRVVALYNPKTSAPFSVLIDRSGRVVAKREGTTAGSRAELDREIEAALSAPATRP